MMQQFFDLKKKHPDAILLFRCGDFYETYCDDAVIASRILGITLTKRNNGYNKGDEMAGFPHHALDTYLPKLIRAGKRVAICDQLEDPKLTKKLVKRGITELVTPGVAMSDNVLSYKENNFLASVNFGRAVYGVSFLDISTGEFLVGEGTPDYVEKLLGNFQPKEVLFERSRHQDFERLFGNRFCTFQLDDWVYSEETAQQKLLRHFGVKSLKGFGVAHMHSGIVAAGAILHYLEMTQHTQIGHITNLSRIEEDKYVRLDKFTLRSLEILQPMQEDGRSLLDVIDNTVSPMGSRLLRRWLVFPLKDKAPIEERLDMVDEFFREPALRQSIDEQLKRVGDLERIISKVATGRVSPREVVQLRVALEAVEILNGVNGSDGSLSQLLSRLDPCTELRERIRREIKNDPQICHIPVVLVTAKTTTSDQITGLDCGADAYVSKPFDPTYLLTLISNIFKNRENVRSLLTANTQTSGLADNVLSPQDKAFMDEFYAIMEKELSNPDLDINHITEIMHVSRSKFYYKVKGLTGEKPGNFFRLFKLNRAAELLREGKYNVSEIADITGFSSLSYFSASFKKQFGVAPSEFT